MRLRRSEVGLIILLSAPACSDLLGLHVASASPDKCEASDECAPGEVCHKEHCLARCREGDECGDMMACDGTACVPTGDHCLIGAKQCKGRTPQTCNRLGMWSDLGSTCPVACQQGACVMPDSCNHLSGCGEDQVSCCTSDPVSATTFLMTYDSELSGEKSVERSVGAFSLDRFEVTVGRFSEFLLSYDGLNKPAEGAGAAPGVLNSGWQTVWSEDPRLMAPNADSLRAGIQACGPGWNAEPDIPVRCVNWFAAAAFCIWDGGRLPSEAEWMAAAVGGEEQREYPWTTSESSLPLDQSHACYLDTEHTWDGPQPVGFRPQGAGRFGHQDLIGNVGEWVADVYHTELSPTDCALRANHNAAACKRESDTALRVAKGGSYGSTSARVMTAFRGSDEPSRRNALIGFRCVRDAEETEL